MTVFLAYSLWWFPISTAALLATVLWLGRNLIITRLQAAVENEFDEKIERLRAELRASEELFRSELRTKEREIEGLRSGAMSAMATRQMALDKRRLEAVDQLWSAVIALGPAKVVSSMMSVIKFEATAEETAKNPKFRAMFEALGTGFDAAKIDTLSASKGRPFVSPMVWAVYSAYCSIAMAAVTRLQILKAGLGPSDYLDHEKIAKLIKTALPHQSAFVDTYGAEGYHFLLEELEEKLLREIDAMLAGVESDKSSIDHAANILKESKEVMKSLEANRGSR